MAGRLRRSRLLIFYNVEGTIITALKAMAGDEVKHGYSLGSLATMIPDCRGRDRGDVMFKHVLPSRKIAVNLLLQAAALAADKFSFSDEMSDDAAKAAKLVEILKVVGVGLPMRDEVEAEIFAPADDVQT